MLSNGLKYHIKGFCLEFDLDYKYTLLFIEEHIQLTQEILKRNLTNKEIFELIEHSEDFLLRNTHGG